MANPAQRARSHHDDVTREKPLLINPAAEDPRRQLSFREEVAYGKTRRGRTTIEALGLNRGPLLERRRELLRSARNLRSAVELALRCADLTSEVRRELERLTTELERDLSPMAEYSLMMKSAFANSTDV